MLCRGTCFLFLPCSVRGLLPELSRQAHGLGKGLGWLPKGREQFLKERPRCVTTALAPRCHGFHGWAREGLLWGGWGPPSTTELAREQGSRKQGREAEVDRRGGAGWVWFPGSIPGKGKRVPWVPPAALGGDHLSASLREFGFHDKTPSYPILVLLCFQLPLLIFSFTFPNSTSFSYL